MSLCLCLSWLLLWYSFIGLIFCHKGENACNEIKLCEDGQHLHYTDRSFPWRPSHELVLQTSKLVTCSRITSLCTWHFKTSLVFRFSRLDPTHRFFGLVVFFSSYFGQRCRAPSLGTKSPKLGMITVIGPPGLNEIKQTDVSSFGRNVTVKIESDNADKIQLNLKVTCQLFLLHSSRFIFLKVYLQNLILKVIFFIS